jgi:hypothetical protein
MDGRFYNLIGSPCGSSDPSVRVKVRLPGSDFVESPENLRELRRQASQT